MAWQRQRHPASYGSQPYDDTWRGWSEEREERKGRNDRRAKRHTHGNRDRRPEWECGRCGKLNFMDKVACRACGWKGPNLESITAPAPQPATMVASPQGIQQAERALEAAKGMPACIIEPLEKHLAQLKASSQSVSQLDAARARMKRAESLQAEAEVALLAAQTKKTEAMNEATAAQAHLFEQIAKTKSADEALSLSAAPAASSTATASSADTPQLNGLLQALHSAGPLPPQVAEAVRVFEASPSRKRPIEVESESETMKMEMDDPTQLESQALARLAQQAAPVLPATALQGLEHENARLRQQLLQPEVKGSVAAKLARRSISAPRANRSPGASPGAAGRPPVQLSLDAFAEELEGEGLEVPEWLKQGNGRQSFQKALHAIMMKERPKPY